ncbi:hypothetical protein Dsin_005521 [Dipteronia sinensis]|uniref:Uncharacterized protein n=1 Tax=Dipteronia sinensis TaxID=43782 RepID=A0AAE0AXX7_9ROSI|nr:hypothetical protein Dsin_005521 [Dipteronia sinensis]
MVSDSITNAPIPSAPNSKDFSKKKRANRSAKLKQCKLDARREQWLSQGTRKQSLYLYVLYFADFVCNLIKNCYFDIICFGYWGICDGLIVGIYLVAVKSKGCKEEGNCAKKERDRSLENPRRRDEDNNDDKSIHHESDSESPSNSPTNSLLGGGGGSGGSDSGTNFIGSSSSRSSISGSSSGGCCSGSITEEEEEDGCLDDWEAVADALAADDNNNKPEPEPENSYSQSPSESQLSMQSDSTPELTNGLGIDSASSMTETESARMVPRISGNNTQAWRPDDAYRPQCLPNLAKQRSFPATNRHFGHGGVPWSRNSVLGAPSSCPICYEDWTLQIQAFCPVYAGFVFACFVTRGFSRRMGGVLAAGSHMSMIKLSQRQVCKEAA